MKHLFIVTSIALFAATASGSVAAQPVCANKQVRLIVPTPAGGPSDVAARHLVQALSKSMGYTFVVENRPGASGAVAAQALMAAARDGCTLMWTLSSMSGLPALLTTPPYQSLAELTPVSLVGHLTYAMFVHPDVPAKSVAEFVDYTRAYPDKTSYATGTLGDYMAGTKFLKTTGARSVRVPYKGAAQLMPDLITGRVQLYLGPISSGLPYVKEGKLRMLAVLLPKRSTLVPDVPTMSEVGYPAVALPTWQAVFAPAGTSATVIDQLSREIGSALAQSALREQLELLAIQVEASTPQMLATMAERDTKAWRAFVSEYAIPNE